MGPADLNIEQARRGTVLHRGLDGFIVRDQEGVVVFVGTAPVRIGGGGEVSKAHGHVENVLEGLFGGVRAG